MNLTVVPVAVVVGSPAIAVASVSVPLRAAGSVPIPDATDSGASLVIVVFDVVTIISTRWLGPCCVVPWPLPRCDLVRPDDTWPAMPRFRFDWIDTISCSRFGGAGGDDDDRYDGVVAPEDVPRWYWSRPLVLVEVNCLGD